MNTEISPDQAATNRRIANRWAVGYYLALVLCGAVFALVLFRDDWLIVKLLFLTVVLLIPWHHSAVFLLVMLQATLLLREPASDMGSLAIDSVPLAVLTLFFLSMAGRFRTTWQVAGKGRPGRLLAEASSMTRSLGQTSRVSFPLDRFGRQLLLVVLTSIACVAVAVSWLELVPESRDAYDAIRLRPQELRSITLGVMTIVGGVVGWHLLSGWFWRTLSPGQARLYLRTTLAQWLAPETGGVARRKLKRRGNNSAGRDESGGDRSVLESYASTR